MHLDVFKSSGFELASLTKALNDVPFMPTRLGASGIFTSDPITTTEVTIERQGETLALVPSAARGAPGQKVVPDRRNIRKLITTHLPTEVTVLADEVQNLRAFGTESDEATALAWLTRKMAVARRRLELTLEWQRMGALKGIVLDSDASTPIVNLFTEFGVAQQTFDFDCDNTSAKMMLKCLAYKRLVEDELGGLPYSRIILECSPTFYDAFTTHVSVLDAFNFYQANRKSSDMRDGFDFGGLLFREYRGKVGATPFVEDQAAYPVIEGTPDLYLQNWAPAPYLETVNTMGMPFYSKMEALPMNKGYTVEMQSNPLIFTSKPRAQVKAFF